METVTECWRISDNEVEDEIETDPSLHGITTSVADEGEVFGFTCFPEDGMLSIAREPEQEEPETDPGDTVPQMECFPRELSSSTKSPRRDPGKYVKPDELASKKKAWNYLTKRDLFKFFEVFGCIKRCKCN